MPGLALGLSPAIGGGKIAESTLWDDLIEYIPMSESSDGSGAVTREGSYLGTKWTDAANAPSDTGHVHDLATSFTRASSQYLYRTDHRFSLPSSGSWTFAAWVYRVDELEEGYRGIFNCEGTNCGYNVFITHDATLVADLNQTNYHNADFDGIPMTRLTWHLVRCWYDATAGTWNNQLDDGPIGTWEVAAPARGGTLQIGTYFTNYWDGLIGPLMWWSKVLSTAEYAELYNAGTGVAYDGPAADPEWAPTTIDDCILWLDAEDLDGTGNLNNGVADQALVETWADKSGNDFDMTQATEGSRPMYRSGIHIGTVDYRPCVQFASKYLSHAAALGGGAGTVIVACKLIATIAAYQGLLTVADEASDDHFLLLGPYFDGSSPGIYARQDNGDTVDHVCGSTTTEADASYIMVWQSSGSAYSFRINGAAETPSVIGGSNTGDWFGDISGADNTTIGILLSASPFFALKAHVAELLVYSRALSATEIATVEAWLAAKWGISV